MDSLVLFWMLIGTGIVVVLALGLCAYLASANRKLRAQITTRDRALEVETAAAGHTSSPHQRQVALIINPSKHESHEVMRQVHAACSRASMPAPLVFSTTPEDPGYGVAVDALEQDASVVIAAGGDGTVRSVATALKHSDAALGVIPLGTGNLFARNIGLSINDVPACVDAALHGLGHWVDTLELTVKYADEHEDKQTSLVIAGGGLDAQVMGDTRETLKQRAGWLAYGEAGLRHLMGSRSSVEISLDDGAKSTHRVRSVLLANCGSLQAGMVLVPTAKFDDGLLDAVLFTPRHPWDWARIVAKTVTRFTSDIPVMKVRQAEQAQITMAEAMPFQIDGDALGEVLAVDAQIEKHSLLVNGVSAHVLKHSEVADVGPATRSTR